MNQLNDKPQPSKKQKTDRVSSKKKSNKNKRKRLKVRSKEQEDATQKQKDFNTDKEQKSSDSDHNFLDMIDIPPPPVLQREETFEASIEDSRKAEKLTSDSLQVVDLTSHPTAKIQVRKLVLRNKPQHRLKRITRNLRDL